MYNNNQLSTIYQGVHITHFNYFTIVFIDQKKMQILVSFLFIFESKYLENMQKHEKKQILTTVWRAQQPNTCQNIQNCTPVRINKKFPRSNQLLGVKQYLEVTPNF